MIFFLDMQFFKCEQCCMFVLLPSKPTLCLSECISLLLCSAWARGCWYRSVMRWQGQRPCTSCSVSSWVALQCILKMQWKSLQDILLDLMLLENCSEYNFPSSWRWGQCVTRVCFLWYMLKSVPVGLPRSIV